MATTTDTDAAAVAGVAVPVSSRAEYTDAVAAAAAKPGNRTLTADATDPTIGWTAQSKWSVPDPGDVPGQLFTPEQLPDPNVAVRAGLAPVVVPEYLVIEDDDDNPQGPEPYEIGADPREVRAAIRERTIKDTTDRAKALEDAKKSAEAPAKKAAAAPAATKSS